MKTTLVRVAVFGFAMPWLAFAAGDTFTWTGSGDGKLWSNSDNWKTDSTTHAVPASGDRVIVTGLAAGAVVSNDIAGLSLPYLEFGGSTATPYFQVWGQAITLTGGTSALVARSGRFKCYIPFVLVPQDGDPEVWFDFASKPGGTSAGGRMEQDADISGSGKLFLNYPYYFTPNVNMSYTGGTVCNGGTVDPSALHCFGVENSLVEVRGCQFRFYNTAKTAPYAFKETSTRTDHAYFFWYDPQAVGSFAGKRFAMTWNDAARTFNGPVTVDEVQIYGFYGGMRGPVTFNGRVETAAFNAKYNDATGNYYTNVITYCLNAANNALGDLYPLCSVFKAGAVNAFGTNTVVHPCEQSAVMGTLDCCGFDQTIDRVVLNASHPISASRPEGHLITSTTGPATLTLAATADAETDALFGGELSLVWNPKGDYTFRTYASYGRPMPMTGALIVSNGTFEVNGANRFPFLTRLEVAPGATLRVAEGTTAPFREYVTTAGFVLDLASTASLVLPEGCALAASEIRTNGVALAANTAYTGDPDAEDAVYLPQLAGGAGRVIVNEVGNLPTVAMPLSAKAYVQNGLVGLLDGYENAGWGTHDAAATTWKDLAGEIGDFAVSNTVGQFTASGLRKVNKGTLAWCASRVSTSSRPTNVRTVEAAVSDLDQATGGVVMPFFMGQREHMILYLTSATERKLTLDYMNLGIDWIQPSQPSSTTLTGFYNPLVQGTGLRVDAATPAGTAVTDDYSDGSRGLTLGGRWISWNGNDTSPYGYSLNAMRFYSRELTDAEVTNNWVVDSFRFRGTVPADTPDYKAAADGTRILCRVTLLGLSDTTISVNGQAAAAEKELWVEPGTVLALSAKFDEQHAFNAWLGDVSAICDGTAGDATVAVLVDRAMTLSAGVKQAVLEVRSDMTLEADRGCAGVRFHGPYTISAVNGARLTIDEGGSGIAVEDGVTGTATIACPLTIGAQGGAQTLAIPSGATLAVTGALSGNAALTASAGGGIQFLGGGDMAGNWDFSEGRVDLAGVFSDATGYLRVSTNAPLYLANADLAKLLKCAYSSDTKLTSVANTTNVLRGGWAQLYIGTTPTWRFDTGANSELTFYGAFNSGTGGIYPTIRGSGTVHFRTTSDKIGCLTLNSGVTMHVWKPLFSVTRSNYNWLLSGAKLYLHTESALSKSPWGVAGKLDLGGLDQTMGRFSYMSSWNADGSPNTFYTTGEIHSDEPATLTVNQDGNAAGGGNSGLQVFGGRFTGQASLVRSCASDYVTTVASHPLYLAGASTATGTVFATCGLLGFTNYVYKGTSYVGSWPNCTEAGARDRGTLELTHSNAFGRNVKIRVGTGGKMRLAKGVYQMVDGVYLGDETKSRPYGTYGSSASSAKYKDDTYFEGTGVIVYPNPGCCIMFR